ncbi:MAG: UDP-N-acetylmuramate dehydrogenase [Clostridia bacterium]|nr:UDP-N-acetylmuramate dehydrogenase [Clostridia bacterium]
MDVFAVFLSRFPKSNVERNFSFACHTTVGCGGTAALAVSPCSTEECAAILGFLKKKGIPYVFLGAGANVLAGEGFYEGVVVRFRNMRRLDCENSLICADAGVSLGRLVNYAGKHNLGGVEPFVGIPATVGGGTAMNAGIRDGHFSDLVEKVVGIENGRVRTFLAGQCEFSEKDSVFLQQEIAVTQVCLRAKESCPERIAQELCYFRNRRAHLPKGRSMGCTFVNPQGQSAGELIDRCGLKGLRIGGARVSEAHANFILNESGTADDVAQLIEIIKQTVKERTGILLREEIRRIAGGSAARGVT